LSQYRLSDKFFSFIHVIDVGYNHKNDIKRVA